MPTYNYRCPDCRQSFDVVKSMADIDRLEECPSCAAFCNPGTRQITRTHFYGAGDWNSQTWNPALGCYTKSASEARKIAKSRGYEEVGNEPVEKMVKHFEKQREKTREERWQDADREKLYD